MDYIPYVKFQFEAKIAVKFTVLCNIQEKELSYQEYDNKRNLKLSYGIRLTDQDIEDMHDYINAVEFEKYRGNDESMSDKGYCGYRDEYSLSFTGITDSEIPIIYLSLDLFYKEGYKPPQHRLYGYIVEKYFMNKKYKKAIIQRLGY